MNISEPCTLVLFDIDGTLVDARPQAGLAFEEAFESYFGIPQAGRTVTKSGRTDFEILADVGLQHLGRALQPDEIIPLNAAYVACLKNGFGTNLPRILPGVTELLRDLSEREHIVLGLQTGNIQDAARVKLESANLWDYFSCGSFGCSAVSRQEIVAWAFQDAEDRGFVPKDVFLVGDSPSDILAGRANGCRTIGVATGDFSVQDLADVGADFVIESLLPTKPILRFITSGV